MCIATYTDVKNNPHYGPRKLNLGLPFSVATPYDKQPYSGYFFIYQLFLCIWLRSYA